MVAVPSNCLDISDGKRCLTDELSQVRRKAYCAELIKKVNGSPSSHDDAATLLHDAQGHTVFAGFLHQSWSLMVPCETLAAIYNTHVRCALKISGLICQKGRSFQDQAAVVIGEVNSDGVPLQNAVGT